MSRTFPLYVHKPMSKSLLQANNTYFHLIIPKQCENISEGINETNVFISYEVSVQFCWERVRCLEEASLEA